MQDLEKQLIEKYRPTSFDEVLGNTTTIKSLRDNLASSTRPHAFMLKGPYGCGKTSTAKIIAKEIGTQSDASITIINAAISGGVDDTRALVETITPYPLDGGNAKVLIIDECQELSKKAWTPFLDILEDPPAHAYFIFTTSDPDKVNSAIWSRVQAYTVEPLEDEIIADFLSEIVEIESMSVDLETVALVATSANGSMRQALSNLSLVQNCTLQEAEKLLASKSSLDQHATAYQLAEMIFKHKISDFSRYKPLIDDISNSPASDWGKIKNTLLSYANTNMMFANSTDQAATMGAVFSDIKQMKKYFDDKPDLKAELIEVCLSVCLHLP